MKYEYKDLPNFIIGEDKFWRVYNYSRVLVPTPESEEEALALEE
jgi:hypothetical protein